MEPQPKQSQTSQSTVTVHISSSTAETASPANITLVFSSSWPWLKGWFQLQLMLPKFPHPPFCSPLHPQNRSWILRGGESLSPSSAGFISKDIPAACHILKQFYITIPQCQRDVDMGCVLTHPDAPAPIGNRWLCLQAYSNIYLMLSFTHYLMFGEEFTHLSASAGFSQVNFCWSAI